MFVEVVDRFPLRFGGGLARGFPTLKRRFALVADHFIAAQRGADDLSVAQIAGFLGGAAFELGNETAHATNGLTEVKQGWTRIINAPEGHATPCAPSSVVACAAGSGLPARPANCPRVPHPCLSVFIRG